MFKKKVELNWETNEISVISDDVNSNHAFDGAMYCQPEKLEMCLNKEEAIQLRDQIDKALLDWETLDICLEESNQNREKFEEDDLLF